MRELPVAMRVLWGARGALVAWRDRLCQQRQRHFVGEGDVADRRYHTCKLWYGNGWEASQSAVRFHAVLWTWRQAPFAKSSYFLDAACIAARCSPKSGMDMKLKPIICHVKSIKKKLGARHLWRYFQTIVVYFWVLLAQIMWMKSFKHEYSGGIRQNLLEDNFDMSVAYLK